MAFLKTQEQPGAYSYIIIFFLLLNLRIETE